MANFWLDVLDASEGKTDTERVEEIRIISKTKYGSKLVNIPEIKSLFSVHRILDESSFMYDFSDFKKSLQTISSFHAAELVVENVKRISRSHIDSRVVKYVKEKLTWLQRCGVSNCRFPTQEGFTCNQMVFRGHRQNDFYAESFALAWLAYFDHGIVTGVFMTDQDSASEFRKKIYEFNSEIMDLIDQEIERSPSQFHNLSVVSAHYCLNVCSSDNRLMADDVLIDSGSRWSNLRSIIRIWRISPSEQRMQILCDDMEVLVSNFGYSSNRRNVNVMLIADSSRQPVTVSDQIIEAVSAGARLGCQNFSARNTIDPDFASEIPVNILVSASMFVTVDSEAGKHIKNLPGVADRREWIKSIIRVDFLSDLDAVQDEYLLCQQACSRICRKSSSFEHVAIYWRAKQNSGMDALATLIALNSHGQDELRDAGGLNECDRPVVVLCCYARSSAGYGMSMYMNRFADEHLKPRLLQAEKAVMSNACELKSFGQCPKPKSGDWFLSRVAGKAKARMLQRSRMNDGLVCGKHFLMDDSSVIRLPPRRKAYGLRTALSMIEECCRLARIPAEKLFIVTLSKRRLRNGLPFCTWDGGLRPTVILCPRVCAKGDGQEDFAKTLRALASVCGPRRESLPGGHACRSLPVILARARDVKHIGDLQQRSSAIDIPKNGEGSCFSEEVVFGDELIQTTTAFGWQPQRVYSDLDELQPAKESTGAGLDEGLRGASVSHQRKRRGGDTPAVLVIDEDSFPSSSNSDYSAWVLSACPCEGDTKSSSHTKRRRREPADVGVREKPVIIDLTAGNFQGGAMSFSSCPYAREDDTDCRIIGTSFHVSDGAGGIDRRIIIGASLLVGGGAGGRSSQVVDDMSGSAAEPIDVG